MMKMRSAKVDNDKVIMGNQNSNLGGRKGGGYVSNKQGIIQMKCPAKFRGISGKGKRANQMRGKVLNRNVIGPIKAWLQNSINTSKTLDSGRVVTVKESLAR